MTLPTLFLILAATASSSTPTVTLDVKDADVLEVLASMKTQCGIKNMVIDPDVKGTAPRIKFREVPCETAFSVVFKQFGLTGQYEANVTTVQTRKR